MIDACMNLLKCRGGIDSQVSLITEYLIYKQNFFQSYFSTVFNGPLSNPPKTYICWKSPLETADSVHLA